MGHTVTLIPPQYVKPFVRTNKNDWNVRSRDRRSLAPSVDPHGADQDGRSAGSPEPAPGPTARYRVPDGHDQPCARNPGRVRGCPEGLRRQGRRRTEPAGERSGRHAGVSVSEGNASRHGHRAHRTQRETGRLRPPDCPVCEKEPRLPAALDRSRSGRLDSYAFLLALVGDPFRFKNGRHFAAYVGLVPRQHSSGGKNVLLGISKRGDTYLRTLLIHGGRAVVRSVQNLTSGGLDLRGRNAWIADLVLRRGFNRAAVAVANKNARILWTLLTTNEAVYDPTGRNAKKAA